jgi:SAM-dependent methyltransferase
MSEKEMLKRECLFCNPVAHGQGDQVLLRSDNFYLFAGTGPMVEGYIIITPYTCNDEKFPFHTYADISPMLLDEAIFLRGLVSEYYRDVYQQEASMDFEHGRIGSCFPGSGSSMHCFHAHLCCFPRSFRLWEDMEGLIIKDVDNLHSLQREVESTPYLLVESSFINYEASEDSNSRENWVRKIALLDKDKNIPSQYLRRLLSSRLEIPFEWDWALFPRDDLVRSLIKKFKIWIRQTKKYELSFDKDLIPRIDFIGSVEKSNQIGNNNVAEDFRRTWANRIQLNAVDQFIQRLPHNHHECLKVLDCGCGPGNYVKAFWDRKIACLGIDISECMIDYARFDCFGNLSKGEKDCDPYIPRIENIGLLDHSLDNEKFHGIWFSAVVVHLPRRLLPLFLSRFHDLLWKNGILYISALIGSGSVVRREGRVFYYYENDELNSFFEQAGFSAILDWYGETEISARGGSRKKCWHHFILEMKENQK